MAKSCGPDPWRAPPPALRGGCPPPGLAAAGLCPAPWSRECSRWPSCGLLLLLRIPTAAPLPLFGPHVGVGSW
eukprot:5273904-Pyramimonas_sp.AAC.1